MLIKEISNGNGKILIYDDFATKDPKEKKEIIDNVSKIIIDYYRRKNI